MLRILADVIINDVGIGLYSELFSVRLHLAPAFAGRGPETPAPTFAGLMSLEEQPASLID